MILPNSNIAKREYKDDIMNLLHDILNLIVYSFILVLSLFTPSLLARCILIGLGVTEIALSIAYSHKIILAMMVHFLYQSVAFSIPCFLFYIDIYHEFYYHRTNGLLELHSMGAVRSLIDSHFSLIITAFIYILWIVRLLLSFMRMLDAATEDLIQEYTIQCKQRKIPILKV